MDATNEFSFILKPATYGIGVFAVHDIRKNTSLRLFGTNNPLRLIKKEEIPDIFTDFCASRGDMMICPPDFGYMPVGWYLNHSNTPNAVRENNADKTSYGNWIADKDIKAGEEVTIDYNALDEPDNDKEKYYHR